jgi:CHAD domain-containing protein
VAKPRPIPDLDPSAPYASAAAKVVAARAAEIAEHADGVQDLSDIERLHDMRVATRRLRAALEVFESCFPRKAFAATLAEVKRLADALGERRDRDVAIAALEEFASRLPAPDRPGIESLVARFRIEQAEANDALSSHVTDERLAGLRDHVRELVIAAERTVGERPGSAMQRVALAASGSNGSGGLNGEPAA